MRFNGNSSAGNAKLNNAGKIFFADFATGGLTTITNTASGNIDIREWPLAGWRSARSREAARFHWVAVR